MNYSNVYLGVIVSLLAAVLPRVGVEIGSDELTTAVSVIVTVVGSLWALRARHQMGGISLLGVRH